MEKAGGISKLVTVVTVSEKLLVLVNTAGTPLTIVSLYVVLPVVMVKVPAGDSVPAACRSHILVSSGLMNRLLAIVDSSHDPFTETYTVSSFTLNSRI